MGCVATTSLALCWNARFTTNGMCAKKNVIYVWYKHAIIEWSRHVISIVACCHSAKLCMLSRSSFPNRNKMVLWPGCEGGARFRLHTENVRSVRFIVKRRGCCCNHSAGVALKCAVRHEWNLHKEKHYICMARTSNNRVIVVCDLYCCWLPQCETWRACCSGFPIATVGHSRFKFTLVSSNQHRCKALLREHTYEGAYLKTKRPWACCAHFPESSFGHSSIWWSSSNHVTWSDMWANELTYSVMLKSLLCLSLDYLDFNVHTCAHDLPWDVSIWTNDKGENPAFKTDVYRTVTYCED